MKNNAKAIENFILVISILCMVYYSFGVKFISPIFNYFDDLFALLFLLYGFALSIKKSNQKKCKTIWNKYEKIFFILLCCIIFIGIIGNFVSKYQTSILSILVDILSYLKFFGVFLAGIIVFEKSDGVEEYTILERTSKIILIVNLLIYISNVIFDWGLATRYNRYGLISYSLGGHPSYASAISCFCLSILFANQEKNKWWLVVGLFLTVISLRMKAIVYVVLMIIYLIFYDKNRYFSLKNLALFFIIAVALAHKYIFAYFFDFTASRGAAMIASISLAEKFFPIGSGFATFGTVQSILSYSMAYSYVGLDTRYGFTPSQGAFVGDGGWATHIGQFGFSGALLIAVMFVLIYFSIKEHIDGKAAYTPFVSLLLYLLISSTSEIAFTSNYAILFALAIVILIKKANVKS